MGNRISIAFDNNGDKSVTLFSHWQGQSLVAKAHDYISTLKAEVYGKEMSPLDRLEPNTVMVDFIRHITKDKERITGDLYLGVDENDGDNSDNGHQDIKL